MYIDRMEQSFIEITPQYKPQSLEEDLATDDGLFRGGWEVIPLGNVIIVPVALSHFPIKIENTDRRTVINTQFVSRLENACFIALFFFTCLHVTDCLYLLLLLGKSHNFISNQSK